MCVSVYTSMQTLPTLRMCELLPSNFLVARTTARLLLRDVGAVLDPRPLGDNEDRDRANDTAALSARRADRAGTLLDHVKLLEMIVLYE